MSLVLNTFDSIITNHYNNTHYYQLTIYSINNNYKQSWINKYSWMHKVQREITFNNCPNIYHLAITITITTRIVRLILTVINIKIKIKIKSRINVSNKINITNK